MGLPTSTFATSRTEYAATLETLPVDILCVILEQSNSISDLVNATHGCPALLRTRNIFEKQIVFATLCNQFEPGELIPVHLACTLPASKMFEICDFENKLETVRSSKPQNTAGPISPTKFRVSLCLGHQIEAFHKTLLQLMDRYYNEGPGSPIDPEDFENSMSDRFQYFELHSGARRGCNSPHDQTPEAVPSKIERLRFLHALCNLEIVRKLVGGWWCFDQAEKATWRHCVLEMKKVFSIHDWGSMNSVISFLDDHTQPYYAALLTRLEKGSSFGMGISPLRKRLETIVRNYGQTGGLTPEFFYAVSMGLETCLDMMNNPNSPKQLGLLITHHGGYLWRHLRLYNLIPEVLAVDDSMPVFSQQSLWGNLIQLPAKMRPDEPERVWQAIQKYPLHEVNPLLTRIFEHAESSDMFFVDRSAGGKTLRSRCRCRRGNNW